MLIKLTNVRLSFFHGFQTRDYKNNGIFKFSTSCIVEKGSPNDKLIEKTSLAAVEEKYPGKGAAKLKSFKASKNTTFYREGNEEDEGSAGKMVVAAGRLKSKGRPKIVDRNNAPLTEEDGKPYSGCCANVFIDVWAQTGDTPGVRAELVGIQFVKDGEAFSGGVSTNAIEFDDLGVDDEAVEDGAEDLA